MSSSKKIRIILPAIIVLFFAAYAEHKYFQKKEDITGHLQNREMDEISGIAASTIHDGVYYVHNDSGDTSRFFAITPDGEIKSVIYYKADLKVGLGVHDCDDIAVGPGPERGKSYVYIGDIGDSDALRPYITVYRMEEKKSWIGRDSIIRAD